jgi:hypothetical protein
VRADDACRAAPALTRAAPACAARAPAGKKEKAFPDDDAILKAVGK